VKQFIIKVGTIKYSVQQIGNIYTVLDNDIELFKLTVTVGKNLVFSWKTVEGETSHLIDRIGLAIELHDIAVYL
jgi:hypothetical protein